MQLIMFTKRLKELGNLSLEEAGKYVREMGFSGVELPVRRKGTPYVLPEEVKERLPEAVRTLESIGLSVPMITIDITDAKENYADDVFRTASECGVKLLSLGAYRYQEFGTIKKRIGEARSQLKGIEALAREYGVTAVIQTHSGAFTDPGHLALEGGIGGWKMGIDLLKDYTKVVAVKNFGWFQVIDEKTGEKKWAVRKMPLEDGIVPWPKALEYIRKIGFDGCFSFYSPYDNLSFEELIEQTKRDLNYFQTISK